MHSFYFFFNFLKIFLSSIGRPQFQNKAEETKTSKLKDIHGKPAAPYYNIFI